MYLEQFSRDSDTSRAAAAGAFGAILLSWFYKTLKWQSFKESVFLTAKTTAMIMWLFIGSWTFAAVFSYLGGHEVFEHFFKSMDLAPWQFLSYYTNNNISYWAGL